MKMNIIKTMEKENSEKKKKYTFHLRCTKCAFKFSIEREYSSMNKIDITKMKCLDCGKPIMWDTTNFPAGGTISKKEQSNANILATKEAHQMANNQKKIDSEMGTSEMVDVRSTQKGKNFGKIMKIPKRVIDSIKEKIGGEDAFDEKNE